SRPGDAASQDRQPELQEQALVEREATARRRQRRVRFGEVGVADRLGQAHEAPAGADTLREYLGHLGGVRLDEAPQHGTTRAERESFGERIDRNKTARVQPLVLAVLDDFIVGLLQDDRALVASDAAVEHELLTALEHT